MNLSQTKIIKERANYRVGACSEEDVEMYKLK
jgi:hypothetical protein